MLYTRVPFPFLMKKAVLWIPIDEQPSKNFWGASKRNGLKKVQMISNTLLSIELILRPY